MEHMQKGIIIINEEIDKTFENSVDVVENCLTEIYDFEFVLQTTGRQHFQFLAMYHFFPIEDEDTTFLSRAIYEYS